MSFAAFCTLATAGCAGGTEMDVDGVSRAEQALSALPTLGAASSFAVLANQAVTCTDASIIGSVGTNQATPTGSVTQTNCPVIGAVEVGTLASRAAYASFLTAYDALEAQPCDRYLTGTLAGVILAPGTYCFTAAATLTGTLTLDGPSTASWLFKVGTLGTGALTGTSFNVQMANGGSACNVSWWVAEAATLTDSNFVGNLFAGAADTVTRGTFEGRTFSKADVTLTGAAMVGCVGGIIGGGPGDVKPPKKAKCNQGVGNGAEGCDPGNSNHNQPSNDETGGTPGKPGRKP
ncbi:MAG: ice-binding family protein [Archangium sp.]|nr:ice-binding family protein [Archangium sp.]MDP3572673.1 ice-binding family protein [Archangium sp.]